jgi:hypothetical protein
MNEYVDRGELAVAVRDWIERGKIVGEEIRHILVQHEGSRDPVDTIRAEDVPKSADGEAADEFVEKIAKKIESDAAGYKGTLEQYYVELFTGTRERSTSRFTCSCAIDKSERRGRTERADEKGALALAMRLANHRSSAKSSCAKSAPGCARRWTRCKRGPKSGSPSRNKTQRTRR